MIMEVREYTFFDVLYSLLIIYTKKKSHQLKTIMSPFASQSQAAVPVKIFFS